MRRKKDNYVHTSINISYVINKGKFSECRGSTNCFFILAKIMLLDDVQILDVLPILWKRKIKYLHLYWRRRK